MTGFSQGTDSYAPDTAAALSAPDTTDSLATGTAPSGAALTDPDSSVADKASAAKDQAAEAAQAGKQAASDVASTASDAAKDVAQETSAQARDLAGKTRGELREQVITQQGAVVESLRSLGDQLAEMTDHIEQQGTAVDLATQARDRVRRAADWLDGREPEGVLDELRKVGRNRPGVFLLTAALAGVAAGRLTRGVVAVHTGDDTDTDTVEGSHRADSGSGIPAAQISRPTPGLSETTLSETTLSETTLSETTLR